MKKFSIFLVMIISVVFITILSGCNKQISDTTYTFNYAYVVWPDGTAEKIKISSWKDYSDGDQIQIRTEDGNVYLFHAVNCVLASE